MSADNQEDYDCSEALNTRLLAANVRQTLSLDSLASLPPPLAISWVIRMLTN